MSYQASFKIFFLDDCYFKGNINVATERSLSNRIYWLYPLIFGIGCDSMKEGWRLRSSFVYFVGNWDSYSKKVLSEYLSTCIKSRHLCISPDQQVRSAILRFLDLVRSGWPHWTKNSILYITKSYVMHLGTELNNLNDSLFQVPWLVPLRVTKFRASKWVLHSSLDHIQLPSALSPWAETVLRWETFCCDDS